MYSGILFAIYLQWESKDSESRTTTIVFYALFLLYILSRKSLTTVGVDSTATVVGNFLIYTIENIFFYFLGYADASQYIIASESTANPSFLAIAYT